MLPRLMMLPLPRAAIFGASAATRKYPARTLAAKSRSKVATSRSAAGPNQENPALLTSTSTAPAWSARWSTWTGSRRSAATNRALPPSAVIVSTTAEPRSASRPCTTISAPCRPSSSAAALPMPEVAPVTRALRPSRSRWSLISRPSDRRTCHAVSGLAGLARSRHGFGGRLDELCHVTGVGDHRDVAGRNLDGGGAHAGGELPLGIRRDRLVVGGDQVPGRQRFPGRNAHHVGEGGRGQRLLHGVHHPCPDREIGRAHV